jgi:hypothetical protein
MDALTVVLLVVIGVISIAQTTFLVRLALEGRRTVQGLERLADRLVTDLTPAARDVTRAAANANHLTEVAVAEMQRLDSVLQEATESWSQATARIHEAVVPTMGRLALAAAGWRLARRGFAIYRRLKKLG